MFNTHIDDGFYVIVVEGVEDRLALLAVFDETGIFKNAKLVRDRRHTHIKLFRDVANAHLSLEKKVKDLNPSAVAHDREKFGKIEEMLVVGQFNFVEDIVMSLVSGAERYGVVPVFHYMPPCFDN